VCTVVLRWSPGEPFRALALRDELVGREFDDPDRWWAEQPDVVGGRDREAGGSWCVTDVATGRTGLVLNRPDKRDADPGAPSRGVLPLAAVRLGRGWTSEVDPTGMASFTLLLAAPDALTRWTFDGERLSVEELPSGTRMVTSGGAEDGKADRYLSGFEQAAFPDEWVALLRAEAPAPDPASLVVRVELEAKVFATVFGQLLTAEPGELSLAWSRTPWGDTDWTTRTWRT
jgi:hypothetical protein